MTIQQAAEATGWSQRMLRYLEQAGSGRGPAHARAVTGTTAPGRSNGCRSCGSSSTEHDLGITDIAFELRMRTDPRLARAVDDWFGAVHRTTAPPEAGIYRRLTPLDELSDTPRNVRTPPLQKENS